MEDRVCNEICELKQRSSAYGTESLYSLDEVSHNQGSRMLTKTWFNADGIKVLRWVKIKNNYASRMLGLIRLG